MEFQIPSFQERYNSYNDCIDNLSDNAVNSIDNEDDFNKASNAVRNFQNLDVKLRLGLGIQEIILNPNFVNEKQGDLKDCHLMYYKLADLWFAYEAFMKFDKSLCGTAKNKILWLSTANNQDFSNSVYINSAFNLCSQEIYDSFSSARRKEDLITYFQHCTEAAMGTQLSRLNDIIARLGVEDFDFYFSKNDILTMTYAVRNNFVHNGESTVAPDEFGFINKKLLLKALYRNLVMLTVEATNISCAKYLAT